MNSPSPLKTEPKKEIPPPKTYVHYAGRWLILPLVNTPVTPNHLKTLRLLTGIAARRGIYNGKLFLDGLGRRAICDFSFAGSRRWRAGPAKWQNVALEALV